MKRAWQILIIFIFCSGLFWLVGSEEKPPEETADVGAQMVIIEEGEEVPKEDNTYGFVDVEGNQYEAQYLEEVPLNSYRPEQMTERNGYKYYLDESGECISRLGIDVSRYQREVDWTQVREAGIEFVIIRLGFRGYGEEGKLVLDELYEAHLKGALDAGLQVGIYFFSQAVSEDEAIEEAEFVLQNLNGYAITGPVVFDTEEIKDDTARTDEVSGTQFTRNCIAFCDYIQAAGYETMIYTNMKWLAFTLEAEELMGYQKWYADYEPYPQCPYEFSIWQYTETGSVPGVDGNIDLNLWFSKEEISGEQR